MNTAVETDEGYKVNPVYSYTPNQHLVVGLHDQYRTALMNSKYYASGLETFKGLELWGDVVSALAGSYGFLSLAIWQHPLGRNVSSCLLAFAVIITALRPVIRLPERIDRYSKLAYGYLELYYRIGGLVSGIRSIGHVTDEDRHKAVELADRLRALELEGDAYQNTKKLLKTQDEIERTLPADRLWLPQE